jgi:hypothetical protein
MLMRGLAALLLALLVAPPLAAQPSPPETTVTAFYARVLGQTSGGLPSPRERGRLAGVLSPGLLRMIETASEVQALCARAAPRDEKPLMLEGALFVGNYEGATEVAYGEVRRDGDLVVAEARLVYVDPRFPKAHRHRAVAWTDRVELRPVDGQWRVHDIRIAGDRSLAGELQAFIDEGRRTCRTR